MSGSTVEKRMDDLLSKIFSGGFPALVGHWSRSPSGSHPTLHFYDTMLIKGFPSKLISVRGLYKPYLLIHKNVVRRESPVDYSMLVHIL